MRDSSPTAEGNSPPEPRSRMEEGWYLMSTRDLEIELARSSGRDDPRASRAKRLTTEEALAYRDAGNLPDEQGRSLRLVLRIEDQSDLLSLDAKRLAFEPDFHQAPTWRKEGSKPVNVVPLRAPEVAGPRRSAWWRQSDLAELEAAWQTTGEVAGVKVPAAYRGFVYKTVLMLRAADAEVTVDAIVDSIARWVPARDVDEIRAALQEANPA